MSDHTAFNLGISIHALLAESDSICQAPTLQCSDFYPRSPCGERPLQPILGKAAQPISIHALLAESDAERVPSSWTVTIFLSTLSLRRATVLTAAPWCRPKNFYPRSPCGERPIAGVSKRKGGLISIHALLAESDYSWGGFSECIYAFLSTLSLRRATHPDAGSIQGPGDFYPRSPCGERPSQVPTWLGIPNFYPRSPCGERPKELALAAKNAVFLSTLSLRRATSWSTWIASIPKDFYPRSPCGERHSIALYRSA